MRKRGFEVISSYSGRGIRLPRRSTARSAGYDIEAAEDVTIPPLGVGKVPTGLKAYMTDDEYLSIHIRSGISFRHCLSLVNDTGIIDADYYNNPDNEGHIIIGIINLSREPVTIRKGDRVAQGIFSRYLTTDDDEASEDRKGGFGSTGI